MPIKKAAAKALRQNERRHVRKLRATRNLKALVKDSRALAVAGKKSETAEMAKKAIKAIDKAVQNKILPKNTAARTKSRLMKTVNAQKA